jgi:hypothetical protein
MIGDGFRPTSSAALAISMHRTVHSQPFPESVSDEGSLSGSPSSCEEEELDPDERARIDYKPKVRVCFNIHPFGVPEPVDTNDADDNGSPGRDGTAESEEGSTSTHTRNESTTSSFSAKDPDEVYAEILAKANAFWDPTSPGTSTAQPLRPSPVLKSAVSVSTLLSYESLEQADILGPCSTSLRISS